MGVEDSPRGIDPARVSEWLAERVRGVRLPLRFELIAGGHSNLTYKVATADGKLFVLRRPPLGAVLATAHDMAREHRIISALAQTDVPVAPVAGLCEDDSVNGAPFYVMEYVHGHVLVDAETVAKHFRPEERVRIGASLAEVLGRLHRVDPDAVGLGDLGRKEAYLARQLRRWRTQWDKSRTRELPAMEQAHALLEAAMPAQRATTIVHGDYRLGNCLTGAGAQIAAVLDWELCTLGDPLADLGYLMNDWCAPGELDVQGLLSTAPSTAPGFQSRGELLEIYSQLSGREVGDVSYYRAFQYWRLAAIVEGVLARYQQGVMGSSANTDFFRARVDGLAGSALKLLQGLGC